MEYPESASLRPTPYEGSHIRTMWGYLTPLPTMSLCVDNLRYPFSAQCIRHDLQMFPNSFILASSTENKLPTEECRGSQPLQTRCSRSRLASGFIIWQQLNLSVTDSRCIRPQLFFHPPLGTAEQQSSIHSNPSHPILRQNYIEFSTASTSSTCDRTAIRSTAGATLVGDGLGYLHYFTHDLHHRAVRPCQLSLHRRTYAWTRRESFCPISFSFLPLCAYFVLTFSYCPLPRLNWSRRQIVSAYFRRGQPHGVAWNRMELNGAEWSHLSQTHWYIYVPIQLIMSITHFEVRRRQPSRTRDRLHL